MVRDTMLTTPCSLTAHDSWNRTGDYLGQFCDILQIHRKDYDKKLVRDQSNCTSFIIKLRPCVLSLVDPFEKNPHSRKKVQATHIQLHGSFPFQCLPPYVGWWHGKMPTRTSWSLPWLAVHYWSGLQEATNWKCWGPRPKKVGQVWPRLRTRFPSWTIKLLRYL